MVQPDLGRRRRRLAGASTTAPGRCCVHAFPTPTSRSCSCPSTPTRTSTTTSSSARSSPRCASAACSSSASGNVVHNLRGMNWKLADDGFDWAQRFDEDAKARMLDDPDRGHPARRAPRLPARGADAGPLHPAALPRRAGRRAPVERPDVLVDGYAYGSLSMTAYTLGLATARPPPPRQTVPRNHRPRPRRTSPTSDARQFQRSSTAQRTATVRRTPVGGGATSYGLGVLLAIEGRPPPGTPGAVCRPECGTHAVCRALADQHTASSVSTALRTAYCSGCPWWAAVPHRRAVRLARSWWRRRQPVSGDPWPSAQR